MDKNYLNIIRSSKPAQFGILLIVFLLLYNLVPHNEGNYFWRLPSLLAFIPIKLNEIIYAALYEWFPLKVWDPIFEMYEEKAAFREFTKSISKGLLFLITFVRELLLGGDKIIDVFVNDAWLKDNDWMTWPALPWTAATVGAFLLGFQLGGIRLALLGGIGSLYVSIFGNWVPSIQTLSFVLITTPICFVLGLSFGIWGYLDKKVETALQPVLNVMQTMPQFAYLVPIIALFGLGDHAGSIATIVIATPPMIRNTILGLKRISPEVVEAGLMSGCTKTQLLFKGFREDFKMSIPVAFWSKRSRQDRVR